VLAEVAPQRVPSSDLLNGRFAKKAKGGKHDFAFFGLIRCAPCGCAVVGDWG
jgi:hypothetical protein